MVRRSALSKYVRVQGDGPPPSALLFRERFGAECQIRWALMLRIEQADDDRMFLAYVQAVIDRILAETVPGIYVTKVDGWFGERWVGFAGKTLGAAGVHFRDELRIPPFVPNRVVCSVYLERQASGVYIEAPPPVALHIDQRSEANLRRRAGDLAPYHGLVWFSGNTASSGRGSILAYVPFADGHEPWFLELVKEEDWRAVRAIGVSPKDLNTGR